MLSATPKGKQVRRARIVGTAGKSNEQTTLCHEVAAGTHKAAHPPPIFTESKPMLHGEKESLNRGPTGVVVAAVYRHQQLFPLLPLKIHKLKTTGTHRPRRSTGRGRRPTS